MEELIKFKLTVDDENTGENIYTDWAYSMESLEEKFYKIDKALKDHQEKQTKEQDND